MNGLFFAVGGGGGRVEANISRWAGEGRIVDW